MTNVDAEYDHTGAQGTRRPGQAGSRSRPSAPRGSPEGRFLATMGRPLNRHLSDLSHREAQTRARLQEREIALQDAEHLVESRMTRHRGGHRPWPLRLFILPALAAEGLTAFVGMEVLVPSVPLATGLAGLAALVGAGIAAVLANRRLNQLPVSGAARTLEVIFVAALTVLRYDSLHVQGADLVAAGGGAVLAALISALGLLGIEEVLVETHTFGIFASRLQAAFRRGRCTRSRNRLGRTEARAESAQAALQQNFLEFLLNEGVGLDEAQGRCMSLHCALLGREVRP